MTDYKGETGEILHELSRFVAFSCRFRRCSDHRIARHGKKRNAVKSIDEIQSQVAAPTLVDATIYQRQCISA